MTNLAIANHHFNGKTHYKWPLILLPRLLPLDVERIVGNLVAGRLARRSDGKFYVLPSGYVKIAIEHGHRNSGFSH